MNAPASDVFGWLTPARMPLWDRSLIRASPRDEPLREGAVFDLVSRALGFRFESTARAVAVDAGRLFAWRQEEGDYESHEGAFVLEPDDAGGSRIRLVADVELPFVLPRLVTERQIRAALSRAADESLFNLKRLAEAGR